jgi:hypothetical protein
MKKVYKGIVEGNIIRLEDKITLPFGTQAILTLKPVTEEEQDTIKDRQMKLLDKGFYLGKKHYSGRDDIYDR